jgi:hypothetical protein
MVMVIMVKILVLSRFVSSRKPWASPPEIPRKNTQPTTGNQAPFPTEFTGRPAPIKKRALINFSTKARLISIDYRADYCTEIYLVRVIGLPSTVQVTE